MLRVETRVVPSSSKYVAVALPNIFVLPGESSPRVKSAALPENPQLIVAIAFPSKTTCVSISLRVVVVSVIVGLDASTPCLWRVTSLIEDQIVGKSTTTQVGNAKPSGLYLSDGQPVALHLGNGDTRLFQLSRGKAGVSIRRPYRQN